MITNLLHIDSSILGEKSVSRQLTAQVVRKLGESIPDLHRVYRDLAAAPIPHLSGAYVAVTLFGEAAKDHPDIEAELALGSAVLDEFLAADIVVLGLGFYNLGIPSQLKAWIDRLAVPGKTFRYGEQGPVGLAGGKRVILVISRGGFYGKGSPTEHLEYGESYLREIFMFLGISNIEVVVAEGIALGNEARKAAISRAEGQIEALNV